jgi:hypothetical protein
VDAAAAGFWGAILGAGLTGLVTFGVAVWAERSSKRRAAVAARLTLVREVMRYRGNPARLVDPLNELPLLFGDDAEVLRLLRLLISSTGTAKDDALGDLLTRLGNLTGLDARVTGSDIRTFLHTI